MDLPPIDINWLKAYVDSLVETAQKLDRHSGFRQAILLRADNVMDVVKAWRDHCGKTPHGDVNKKTQS